MRLVYTEQALESLQEVLDFNASKIPQKKRVEIRDRIIAKADLLLQNPYMGQKEAYLNHLQQSHRRIIEGHYKIVDQKIYITDIFDTRQDPEKMKG